MDSKDKLYYLIIQFFNGNYNAKDFSEQFSDIFNLEIDYSTLTDVEKKVFGDLSTITDRFSSNESDLKKYDCYFDEQQVKDKVEEVKAILNIE